MRFSVQPKQRRYVKGYGFLSFAKNIDRNLSNKYGQKLVDTAKKSATDALKIVSKRIIQKAAEATGDLVGNKFADKMTIISKNQQMNRTQMWLAIKYQERDRYISTRNTKNY